MTVVAVFASLGWCGLTGDRMAEASRPTVGCGTPWDLADGEGPGARRHKALKVLMIGNSFSVCNVVHMPSVAESMGLRLDLASLYISGCSLKRHWTNLVSNRLDAAYRPYAFDYRIGGVTNANSGVAGGRPEGKARIGLLEAMKLSDWDVVTIQQSSSKSWRPETYHPWGDDLVAAIREACPRAEIVLQETWSYTPWDRRLAQWGIDQQKMYDALHAAYADFARKHALRVIPMGTAVQLWRRELPVRYAENSFGGDVVGGRWTAAACQFKRQDGAWLPVCDVFHLGETGEYLQALVWTASLFGVDVAKCPYRPDWLDESLAVRLKKVARLAADADRASGKVGSRHQKSVQGNRNEQ